MTNLNEANMGEFVVEGVTYRYEQLPPVAALEYGARVAKVLGGTMFSVASSISGDGDQASLSDALRLLDPVELAKIGKDALSLCHVQRDGVWVSLKDESEFNRHFKEHADQLYIASIKAVWKIAAPFLPKTLRTKAEGLISTYPTA